MKRPRQHPIETVHGVVEAIRQDQVASLHQVESRSLVGRGAIQAVGAERIDRGLRFLPGAFVVQLLDRIDPRRQLDIGDRRAGPDDR